MLDINSFLLTVVTLFAVGTLIYFLKDTDKYVENLQFIRKVHYLIFLMSLTTGFISKEFSLEDWQILLQLSAMFVFIDVALFQTPDISKIWNAEFEPRNYINKTIRKNEKEFALAKNKLKEFTSVIAETSNNLTPLPVPNTWDEYEVQLRSYLKSYTDTFQFHISIFRFENSEATDTLNENVRQAFNKVESRYNYEIEDANWRIHLIDELLGGRSILLSQKQEKQKDSKSNDLSQQPFIVAFYGNKYSMIIGISTTTDIEVDGIDASHVLNMAKIFEWFMA